MLLGLGSTDGWDTRFLPRQDGRRIVVTGATGGIGRVVAQELDRAGARVVLAVRNPGAGTDVAATMSTRTEVQRLDVSDLSSVRAFARSVGAVDVLVNNAGVMGVPRARTVDGFEVQVATNHLGHFTLSNLLLPRLGDRVVVVGSQAHRDGRLDPDDLDLDRRGYRPYAAYAQSKLATLLFMAELQRRLGAARSSLRVTGGHPGYTATGIQGGTGSRLFGGIAKVGNRVAGMSPERGALSVLFAATMDVPGNSYLGPHGLRELWGSPVPVGRSEAASNPALARALWERSEQLTGTRFPL